MPYFPIPVPFTQPAPAAPQTDMVTEMMKKMFMRNMMSKYFKGQKNDDDDDDDFDEDDFLGSDAKFAEMLFFNNNKNPRSRNVSSVNTFPTDSGLHPKIDWWINIYIFY